MTVKLDLAIRDPKNPPSLKFPARCVRCGKPQETTMKISMNMGVQKRSRQVLMELVVPMCNACAEKERRIALVTLVPFFVSGLIIAAIVFVPAWLISPQGTTSDTIGFPLVFGGFIGLVAGVVGGSLIEFVLRLLFSSNYGASLNKRPLTIFDLFTESEHLLGLSAKLSRDKKALHLEFENDEIAREFAQLNPQEK